MPKHFLTSEHPSVCIVCMFNYICIYIVSAFISVQYDACAVILDISLGFSLLSCVVASAEGFPPVN